MKKGIHHLFPSCLQTDELKYLLKYRGIQEKIKVRQCKINGSSSQVLLESSCLKGKKKSFTMRKMCNLCLVMPLLGSYVTLNPEACTFPSLCLSFLLPTATWRQYDLFSTEHVAQSACSIALILALWRFNVTQCSTSPSFQSEDHFEILNEIKNSWR